MNIPINFFLNNYTININNIKQIEQINELSSNDLKVYDFLEYNIINSVENISYSNIKIKNLVFDKTIISHINFINYNFDNCSFKEYNFKDHVFRNVVFLDCHFYNCNFNNCIFENVYFKCTKQFPILDSNYTSASTINKQIPHNNLKKKIGLYNCSFDSVKFNKSEFSKKFDIFNVVFQLPIFNCILGPILLSKTTCITIYKDETGQIYNYNDISNNLENYNTDFSCNYILNLVNESNIFELLCSIPVIINFEDIVVGNSTDYYLGTMYNIIENRPQLYLVGPQLLIKDSDLSSLQSIDSNNNSEKTIENSNLYTSNLYQSVKKLYNNAIKPIDITETILLRCKTSNIGGADRELFVNNNVALDKYLTKSIYYTPDASVNDIQLIYNGNNHNKIISKNILIDKTVDIRFIFRYQSQHFLNTYYYDASGILQYLYPLNNGISYQYSNDSTLPEYLKNYCILNKASLYKSIIDLSDNIYQSTIDLSKMQIEEYLIGGPFKLINATIVFPNNYYIKTNYKDEKFLIGENIILLNCDLSGVDLSDMSLNKVKIYNFIGFPSLPDGYNIITNEMGANFMLGPYIADNYITNNLQKNYLVGCDFSGLSLHSNMNFENCILDKANFKNCDLSSSRIYNFIIENPDLNHINYGIELPEYYSVCKLLRVKDADNQMIEVSNKYCIIGPYMNYTNLELSIIFRNATLLTCNFSGSTFNFDCQFINTYTSILLEHLPNINIKNFMLLKNNMTTLPHLLYKGNTEIDSSFYTNLTYNVNNGVNKYFKENISLEQLYYDEQQKLYEFNKNRNNYSVTEFTILLQEINLHIEQLKNNLTRPNLKIYKNDQSFFTNLINLPSYILLCDGVNVDICNPSYLIKYNFDYLDISNITYTTEEKEIIDNDFLSHILSQTQYFISRSPLLKTQEVNYNNTLDLIYILYQYDTTYEINYQYKNAFSLVDYRLNSNGNLDITLNKIERYADKYIDYLKFIINIDADIIGSFIDNIEIKINSNDNNIIYNVMTNYLLPYRNDMDFNFINRSNRIGSSKSLLTLDDDIHLTCVFNNNKFFYESVYNLNKYNQLLYYNTSTNFFNDDSNFEFLNCRLYFDELSGNNNNNILYEKPNYNNNFNYILDYYRYGKDYTYDNVYISSFIKQIKKEYKMYNNFVIDYDVTYSDKLNLNDTYITNNSIVKNKNINLNDIDYNYLNNVKFVNCLFINSGFFKTISKKYDKYINNEVINLKNNNYYVKLDIQIKFMDLFLYNNKKYDYDNQLILNFTIDIMTKNGNINTINDRLILNLYKIYELYEKYLETNNIKIKNYYYPYNIKDQYKDLSDSVFYDAGYTTDDLSKNYVYNNELSDYRINKHHEYKLFNMFHNEYIFELFYLYLNNLLKSNFIEFKNDNVIKQGYYKIKNNLTNELYCDINLELNYIFSDEFMLYSETNIIDINITTEIDSTKLNPLFITDNDIYILTTEISRNNEDLKLYQRLPYIEHSNAIAINLDKYIYDSYNNVKNDFYNVKIMNYSLNGKLFDEYIFNYTGNIYTNYIVSTDPNTIIKPNLTHESLQYITTNIENANLLVNNVQIINIYNPIINNIVEPAQNYHVQFDSSINKYLLIGNNVILDHFIKYKIKISEYFNKTVFLPGSTTLYYFNQNELINDIVEVFDFNNWTTFNKENYFRISYYEIHNLYTGSIIRLPDILALTFSNMLIINFNNEMYIIYKDIRSDDFYINNKDLLLIIINNIGNTKILTHSFNYDDIKYRYLEIDYNDNILTNIDKTNIINPNDDQILYDNDGVTYTILMNNNTYINYKLLSPTLITFNEQNLSNIKFIKCDISYLKLINCLITNIYFDYTTIDDITFYNFSNIDLISATNTHINTLDISVVNINSLFLDTCTIDTLNITDVNINSIILNSCTINKLNIKDSNVNDVLFLNNCNVNTVFNCYSSIIENITIEKCDIKYLSYGSSVSNEYINIVNTNLQQINDVYIFNFNKNSNFIETNFNNLTINESYYFELSNFVIKNCDFDNCVINSNIYNYFNNCKISNSNLKDISNIAYDNFNSFKNCTINNIYNSNLTCGLNNTTFENNFINTHIIPIIDCSFKINNAPNLNGSIYINSENILKYDSDFNIEINNTQITYNTELSSNFLITRPDDKNIPLIFNNCDISVILFDIFTNSNFKDIKLLNCTLYENIIYHNEINIYNLYIQNTNIPRIENINFYNSTFYECNVDVIDSCHFHKCNLNNSTFNIFSNCISEINTFSNIFINDCINSHMYNNKFNNQFTIYKSFYLSSIIDTIFNSIVDLNNFASSKLQNIFSDLSFNINNIDISGNVINSTNNTFDNIILTNQTNVWNMLVSESYINNCIIYGMLQNLSIDDNSCIINYNTILNYSDLSYNGSNKIFPLQNDTFIINTFGYTSTWFDQYKSSQFVLENMVLHGIITNDINDYIIDISNYYIDQENIIFHNLEPNNFNFIIYENFLNIKQIFSSNNLFDSNDLNNFINKYIYKNTPGTTMTNLQKGDEFNIITQIRDDLNNIHLLSFFNSFNNYNSYNNEFSLMFSRKYANYMYLTQQSPVYRFSPGSNFIKFSNSYFEDFNFNNIIYEIELFDLNSGILISPPKLSIPFNNCNFVNLLIDNSYDLLFFDCSFNGLDLFNANSIIIQNSNISKVNANLNVNGHIELLINTIIVDTSLNILIDSKDTELTLTNVSFQNSNFNIMYNLADSSMNKIIFDNCTFTNSNILCNDISNIYLHFINCKVNNTVIQNNNITDTNLISFDGSETTLYKMSLKNIIFSEEKYLNYWGVIDYYIIGSDIDFKYINFDNVRFRYIADLNDMLTTPGSKFFHFSFFDYISKKYFYYELFVRYSDYTYDFSYTDLNDYHLELIGEYCDLNNKQLDYYFVSYKTLTDRFSELYSTYTNLLADRTTFDHINKQVPWLKLTTPLLNNCNINYGNANYTIYNNDWSFYKVPGNYSSRFIYFDDTYDYDLMIYDIDYSELSNIFNTTNTDKMVFDKFNNIKFVNFIYNTDNFLNSDSTGYETKILQSVLISPSVLGVSKTIQNIVIHGDIHLKLSGIYDKIIFSNCTIKSLHLIDCSINNLNFENCLWHNYDPSNIHYYNTSFTGGPNYNLYINNSTINNSNINFINKVEFNRIKIENSSIHNTNMYFEDKLVSSNRKIVDICFNYINDPDISEISYAKISYDVIYDGKLEPGSIYIVEQNNIEITNSIIDNCEINYIALDFSSNTFKNITFNLLRPLNYYINFANSTFEDCTILNFDPNNYISGPINYSNLIIHSKLPYKLMHDFSNNTYIIGPFIDLSIENNNGNNLLQNIIFDDAELYFAKLPFN